MIVKHRGKKLGVTLEISPNKEACPPSCAIETDSFLKTGKSNNMCQALLMPSVLTTSPRRPILQRRKLRHRLPPPPQWWHPYSQA